MNVETIRERYPEGTRIELQYMEGESPARMYSGLCGVVTGVDDIGQIHMNWDNGSSLALNPDVDSFTVVPPREKIKVVYVEPGKLAEIREIGTELEDLQKAVQGLIETYYPFDEEVCIVCNDEGKIMGMPLNRAIRDEEGKVVEIIAGPFFICDCSTENFGSLSSDQLEKYAALFEKPEEFYRRGKGIVAVPYSPVKTEMER